MLRREASCSYTLVLENESARVASQNDVNSRLLEDDAVFLPSLALRATHTHT